MANNTITSDYNPNFSYVIPNQAAMSVVPQHSFRPNTLPINGLQTTNPTMFTPSDCNKFTLSTPDLINALASQTPIDGVSSPGLFVLMKNSKKIV